MHRYPRTWINVKSNDPAKKLVVEYPGGASRRWDVLGKEMTIGINEESIERLVSATGDDWMEVYEHVEELQKIEKRCAIVYLKGIIRELREEIASLKKELGRA